MKITVLCVGKVKEKFFKEAIFEYEKRLTRYCKLEICQVIDEKTPDGATEAEERSILEKEGDRILKNLSDGTYVIVLDLAGQKMDSVSFSKKIEKLGIDGKGNLTFIIGGSLGLHEKVKRKADFAVSFSDMTFPHQLMRVILLEQIYRSYRIMNHEPYHK